MTTAEICVENILAFLCVSTVRVCFSKSFKFKKIKNAFTNFPVSRIIIAETAETVGNR